MGGVFFVGLTGLNSSSLGIRNVGNNLANSNTIGYKATNLFFEELRAATTAGAEAGQGVIPTSTQQVWTQGNIQQSQLATDMAIRGAGFFVVSDGISAEFYTRAGNFFLNADGKLVTSDGLFVMGYPVNSATGMINTNTNLVPLDLKPGQILPALATTSIRFSTNLNSQATVGPPPETFSTTVTVYDSLGAAHPVTVRFTKNASAGAWDYEITVPGEDVLGGTAGSAVVINSGQVTFDSTGRLSSPAADVTGITFTPANGADPLTFDWDLYDDADPTKSHLTQFDLPSSTSQTYQNGKGAGTLSEVMVRADGIIEGIFSNGETAALGQLGMALFTSPQNLVRAGNNLYARTTQSGEPTIGTPSTGGRGGIQGFALELSNVDIAEEFIKLILFQRSYQANSRIITTADQITREAIQMKQ
ncbi:MAG: flagellar hook protein FlgE [Acidobacteriota bacterium]